MSVTKDQLDLGVTERDGRRRWGVWRRWSRRLPQTAGAVIDDERALDIARAVCAAFDHDHPVGETWAADGVSIAGCESLSMGQLTRSRSADDGSKSQAHSACPA